MSIFRKKQKEEFCVFLGFHKKQPALIVADDKRKYQFPITMNEPATIDQLTKAIGITIVNIKRIKRGQKK